ncbi:hypothetical protein OsI_33454 [Oryza sativa Indica Group]|uniref:Uncharacterized protein n=1 Tax=Oryza sativa subsp. indica TaxID=39946 RepID=B8BGN9_ORYSI|nr:hypothetical protein OsI_33454 [Oryza sativa Indica Group]
MGRHSLTSMVRGGHGSEVWGGAERPDPAIPRLDLARRRWLRLGWPGSVWRPQAPRAAVAWLAHARRRQAAPPTRGGSGAPAHLLGPVAWWQPKTRPAWFAGARAAPCVWWVVFLGGQASVAARRQWLGNRDAAAVAR